MKNKTNNEDQEAGVEYEEDDIVDPSGVGR